MWSALRSDLTEFVSTVRDESQTVLTSIDSKLAGSGEYDQSGSGDTANVVVGEDGEVTYVDKPSGYEATGIVSTAADEVARLRSLEETYSAPLLRGEEEERKENCEAAGVGNDVDSSLDDSELLRIQQFLTDFDLSSQTEDIASILEKYPDTVKVHFENLVPTAVTYEQFWQRYYYRCDESRVQRSWDDNANKARIARQEAISGGIESVKSMLGGAAKVLGVGGEAAPSTAGSSTYEKYQAELDQQRQREVAAAESGLAASLFGPSGRPPFVMNTAVSDVDESMDDNEEEEEEEEELGWSDDEEEEEEDEEGQEESEEKEVEEETESVQESGADDVSEEQIDFTSPGKDVLQELRKQVAQAEEERDQLHQTVEMQANEIAHLQRADVSGDSPSSDELQKLKMVLFEKDSEIAALKASLEDIHEEEGALKKRNAAKVASVEHDLEEMKSILAAKDDEVKRLNELSAKYQAAANNAEEKWRSNEKALESAQKEIQHLRSELESSKEKAEKASASSERLELDLSKVKAQMEEQRLIFSSTLEEETAKARVQAATVPPPAVNDEESNPSSSLSSAVRLSVSPKQLPVPTPGEEDDDDWGDSWGDEDD